MTADMSYIWLSISALLRLAGAAPNRPFDRKERRGDDVALRGDRVQEGLVGLGTGVVTGREDDEGEMPTPGRSPERVGAGDRPDAAGYQIEIGRLRYGKLALGERASVPRARSTVKPTVLPTG